MALRLPVTFYSKHGTTDTMSRFVRDTNVLANGQVVLFSKTLAEPAKAIGAIAGALIYSWELTLLAFLAGPPTYYIIHKLGKKMKRASKKALQGWAGALGVLEETLNGIRVVKAYTMEGTERRRFLRANRRIYNQLRRIAWIDSATGPSVEALGLTAAVAAGAVGGYWILVAHTMDPEDFFTAMACLAATFDPFRKLAKVWNRFQRAEAAAARVFELQDHPMEKSVPGAPSLARHSKDIEYRNVCFRYSGASEDTLKDVSLKISAGQTVAIVGPQRLRQDNARLDGAEADGPPPKAISSSTERMSRGCRSDRSGGRLPW